MGAPVAQLGPRTVLIHHHRSLRQWREAAHRGRGRLRLALRDDGLIPEAGRSHSLFEIARLLGGRFVDRGTEALFHGEELLSAHGHLVG